MAKMSGPKLSGPLRHMGGANSNPKVPKIGKRKTGPKPKMTKPKFGANSPYGSR